MARRRSKADQEEDIIKALVIVFGMGSYFITYFLTKSTQDAIIVSVFAVTVTITLYIFHHMFTIERLKRSGITRIDKMEGREFEHYLKYLFRSKGYLVKVTRAAGDYGADLILLKNNKKIVLQAKRYSKNVGIEAVQQVYGSIKYYGASEAWVLTNRDYTDAAYKLANSNGVRLINREELIEMILKKPTKRVQ